jgi:hypothetical protein
LSELLPKKVAGATIRGGGTAIREQRCYKRRVTLLPLVAAFATCRSCDAARWRSRRSLERRCYQGTKALLPRKESGATQGVDVAGEAAGAGGGAFGRAQCFAVGISSSGMRGCSASSWAAVIPGRRGHSATVVGWIFFLNIRGAGVLTQNVWLRCMPSDGWRPGGSGALIPRGTLSTTLYFSVATFFFKSF